MLYNDLDAGAMSKEASLSLPSIHGLKRSHPGYQGTRVIRLTLPFILTVHKRLRVKKLLSSSSLFRIWDTKFIFVPNREAAIRKRKPFGGFKVLSGMLNS